MQSGGSARLRPCAERISPPAMRPLPEGEFNTSCKSSPLMGPLEPSTYSKEGLEEKKVNIGFGGWALPGGKKGQGGNGPCWGLKVVLVSLFALALLFVVLATVAHNERGEPSLVALQRPSTTANFLSQELFFLQLRSKFRTTPKRPSSSSPSTPSSSSSSSSSLPSRLAASSTSVVSLLNVAGAESTASSARSGAEAAELSPEFSSGTRRSSLMATASASISNPADGTRNQLKGPLAHNEHSAGASSGDPASKVDTAFIIDTSSTTSTPDLEGAKAPLHVALPEPQGGASPDLLAEMLTRKGTPALVRTGLVQCIKRPKSQQVPLVGPTNGFLIVTANGGLNQMRAAICDMVAVARIMNATLVVPNLDHASFWTDPSEFEDVFDVAHFIDALKGDIQIVRQLPTALKGLPRTSVQPISWSKPAYYRDQMVPMLKQSGVLEFSLTDSRLANNEVPPSLQRLRCRANFIALKYTPRIQALADSLVSRLRSKGSFFVALHLRYEKDMLAFTGCSHGLSAEESGELRALRYSMSRWKEKEIDGQARRAKGACPLTPRETALFLRALGFPSSTVIYVVAGPIFGSKGLEEFTSQFPNTFTHSTLATSDEIAALANKRDPPTNRQGGAEGEAKRAPTHHNLLAAVDHMVAQQSDVFVYTHAGNMARAVEGYRRFEGHLPTISPKRRRVIELIDALDSKALSWDAFAQKMRSAHANRTGTPQVRRPGKNPKKEENFFANPYPGCLCKAGTNLPAGTEHPAGRQLPARGELPVGRDLPAGLGQGRVESGADTDS